MQEKGKWTLQYQDFDNSENSLGQARIKERIELNKRTKRGALRTGRQEWHEVLSKGTYQGWDKKTYPHSPQIVKEIPIK